MKKDVAFNKIINTYVELKKHSQQIIYHVSMGDEPMDLIEYYNKVFIKTTKEIILSVHKNAKIDEKVIKVACLAPQSPLIQNLMSKPPQKDKKKGKNEYKDAMIQKIFTFDDKQNAQYGKPPLIPKKKE